MTAAYQLTAGSAVIRLADNAVIPADPGNADWQAYEAWLRAGNTPAAAAVPSPALAAQAALAQKLAAGLTITSTGTPALSGLYGTTPQDQINLMGTQVAILSSVAIPASYVDSTGAKRAVTSAQMTAIAAAVFAYVAALTQTAATLSAGQAASWPAAAATIP